MKNISSHFAFYFLIFATDSKWLSFSRQLNNYGFTNWTSEYSSKSGEVPQFKIYQHPNFFRSIPNPEALADLLPYLPGHRKRQQKEAASRITALSKAKRARRTPASKSPNGAHPAVTAPPKAKRSRRTPASKSPNGALPVAKTVTPLESAKSISGSKKLSASSTIVSIRTTKKSKKRSTTKSARGLQVTPTASELPTQAPKKRKKSNQVDSNDFEAVIGCLKTPSPQPRSTKAPFISSPPPLSHYLYPKNHPAKNANANFTGGRAAGKLLSSNGSPLPSSLLTVNFVMTPSSLTKNGERTPRASNLSSSQCSPSSSQDGFRMLSWAAQAVESPALNELQNGPPLSVDKAEFMKTMCSPIVPSQKKKQRRSNQQPYATKRSGSGTSSALSAPSPANSSMMGPSPLSLQGPQDSLSELELLRNCLEDVFVTTHASGNAVVPQHCASAANPEKVIVV